MFRAVTMLGNTRESVKLSALVDTETKLEVKAKAELPTGC